MDLHSPIHHRKASLPQWPLYLDTTPPLWQVDVLQHPLDLTAMAGDKPTLACCVLVRFCGLESDLRVCSDTDVCAKAAG